MYFGAVRAVRYFITPVIEGCHETSYRPRRPHRPQMYTLPV